MFDRKYLRVAIIHSSAFSNDKRLNLFLFFFSPKGFPFLIYVVEYVI